MTRPQRLPDWQQRLASFIASREPAPFHWGRNDCALFVCDAIAAMTGHDPAADVRGRYTSERGAARVIRSLGGLRAIGAARFGAEVPPLAAQAGDVGLAVLDGRDTLVLASGGGLWLAPGLGGLQRLPMESAVLAWRCV